MTTRNGFPFGRTVLGCLTLGLVVALATEGCAPRRGKRPVAASASTGISVTGGRLFHDVFTVSDTLVMEERPSVITVAPRVTIDTGGGFLVADEAEHQVRVYTRTGKLTEVFGAGTDQPDSIKAPGRARRLPNGDILVANLLGPLTVISGRPGISPRFVVESLRTVRNVEVLNEREVWLVGSDSSPPSATLFRLDLPTGRINRGFLPPPPHLDKWVTTYMSAVRTARWGDRIAAVHMLSDTLIFLDRSGKERSRVRIPIDPFVAPKGPLPDLKTSAERYAWTAQFTLIMGLEWIADNQLIVQWARAVGNGLEAEMGVLQMDTTGARAWAIAPSPALVAVRGDEFFFRGLKDQARNRWMIAKRRSVPE